MPLSPHWITVDARRMLQTVAIIGAGVAMTGLTAWLVWIIWRGGWPGALARVQLDYLAYACGGVLLCLLVAISALGRRSFAAKGPGGVVVESKGDAE